jgi:hypothetical protein
METIKGIVVVTVLICLWTGFGYILYLTPSEPLDQPFQGPIPDFCKVDPQAICMETMWQHLPAMAKLLYIGLTLITLLQPVFYVLFWVMTIPERVTSR